MNDLATHLRNAATDWDGLPGHDDEEIIHYITCKKAREIADHIEAQEKLIEWQDISTAPMDGTTIDLWCKRSWEPPQTHERSVNMYWCTTHKCWRQRGHEHYVDHFWKPKEGYKPSYLIPELWRPLNLPQPLSNPNTSERNDE